ncbi:MAG: hypothetical protein K0R80_3377 [Clostridia bacterium]|jgi:hypothetical protein|nr:hypothetical protein [Clostridia bacterium]MDF2893010.1 hypothetical protein [Clostridia bacterium]
MKEYQGKSKALMGLGIAIVVLGAIILGILIMVGLNWVTGLIIAFITFIVSFLYKGMVLKITVDSEKVQIYKPLGKKTIKFSNIAFCMVHGIDETDSIIYAFVKKKIGNKTGVKGIKQNVTFEEVVKIINKSSENIDLDINFNMAERITVSLVQNSEELKNEILTTLGGHQKRILNNI